MPQNQTVCCSIVLDVNPNKPNKHFSLVFVCLQLLFEPQLISYDLDLED